MGRDASIYPLGGVTDQSLARARALLAKAKFKPTTLVLYASNCPCSLLHGPGTDLPVRHEAARDRRPDQVLRLRHLLRQDRHPRRALRRRVRHTGPPTTPTAPRFFNPLLDGTPHADRQPEHAYFNSPKYNREIERIDSLNSEARPQAWANLDVEMMRNDPPWAPFLNRTSSTSSPRASAATSSTRSSVASTSPPPARSEVPPPAAEGDEPARRRAVPSFEDRGP